MKLPKLPEPVEWESGLDHPTLFLKRQMRAYGKACWIAALEGAREQEECDRLAVQRWFAAAQMARPFAETDAEVMRKRLVGTTADLLDGASARTRTGTLSDGILSPDAP
jgi:hypothetical protein